jgi:hypothetical protein
MLGDMQELWSRLVVMAVIFGIVAASCGGGGMSEEELEQELSLLTQAQRDLEDWQLSIDAGLSYGDVLSDWPATSARVQRSLTDFDISDISDADRCDVEKYFESLETSLEDWASLSDAVSRYVDGSLTERLVDMEYGIASIGTNLTHMWAETALEPGGDCT